MAPHGCVLHGAYLLSVMFLAEVAAVRDETEDVEVRETQAGDSAAEEDPNFFEWITGKVNEVAFMGPADILLAKASYKARSWYKDSSMELVKVRALLPLHPVGSWRPLTWNKTQERKNAVLSAKAAILANSKKLSEKMIEELPELATMASTTPLIAAPFQFCGKEGVLFEGSGRLKALKLAAEEDPELFDMEVEVEMRHYQPEILSWVQKGVQELWVQYLTEAEALKRESEGHPSPEVLKQIQEYHTFKFGIVKCRGVGNGPCPVYSAGGATAREVPVDSLHGVSRVAAVAPPKGSPHAHALEYWLCDSEEYILDNDLRTVKEYCPGCLDRVKL